MAIYKRGENQIGLAQRAAEQRKQQDAIDRLHDSLYMSYPEVDYINEVLRGGNADTPISFVEADALKRGRLQSFFAAHKDPTIQSLNESSALDMPISGDDLARGKSIRRLMEE